MSRKISVRNAKITAKFQPKTKGELYGTHKKYRLSAGDNLYSVFLLYSGSFNHGNNFSGPAYNGLAFVKRDLLSENTTLYIIGLVDNIGAGFLQNVLNDLLATAVCFAVYQQNDILCTVGIQFFAETSYFVGRIGVAQRQSQNNKSFLVCRICRGNIVNQTAECFTDSVGKGNQFTFLGIVHNTHFHGEIPPLDNQVIFILLYHMFDKKKRQNLPLQLYSATVTKIAFRYWAKLTIKSHYFTFLKYLVFFRIRMRTGQRMILSTNSTIKLIPARPMKIK